MRINCYLCGVKLRMIAYCACLVMLVSGCAHQTSVYTPEGKHFTTDVLNRMTPVKDQGQSQTCWIYAMLAAIET